MRKIFIPIILLILLLNMAYASVTINAPSTITINNQFNFQISGNSGMYAFEMSIPSGVSIVSDPSGGVITDKYRTSYAGSFNLVLKGTTTGSKTFSNIQYTEGSGVQSISSKTVSVVSSTTSTTKVTTTTLGCDVDNEFLWYCSGSVLKDCSGATIDDCSPLSCGKTADMNWAHCLSTTTTKTTTTIPCTSWQPSGACGVDNCGVYYDKCSSGYSCVNSVCVKDDDGGSSECIDYIQELKADGSCGFTDTFWIILAAAAAFMVLK